VTGKSVSGFLQPSSWRRLHQLVDVLRANSRIFRIGRQRRPTPLTHAAGADILAASLQRQGTHPMRAARTLALAAALVACAPAVQAQVVDVSKLSCKEFLETGKDGITIIWSWLYGYYADQDADPIIDFGKLVSQGQKLADFCKANPTTGLIAAAEPIYEAK
jgi:acid stress chaperone HdeB